MYPRILHIYGPLWINSYGLFIALGLVAFLWCINRDRLLKPLLAKIDLANATTVGLLAGVVGGRALFVLQNSHLFADAWWEVLLPWIGGFSLLGTIIAVVGALAWYLHKHQVPILPFFDRVSVYAPLLQAISRIGCFFAGCCYGTIALAGACWTVTYTHPDSLAPLNIPLLPAQLYAAGASLVIFVLMYGALQRWCKKPGQLIMSYLMLESGARFMVDFWRGDRDLARPIMGLETVWGISSYQQVCVLLFLFGLAGLLVVSCRKCSSKSPV